MTKMIFLVFKVGGGVLLELFSYLASPQKVGNSLFNFVLLEKASASLGSKGCGIFCSKLPSLKGGKPCQLHLCFLNIQEDRYR